VIPAPRRSRCRTSRHPIVERQQPAETLAVEDRLRRVIVHVQRQIAVLDAQEDIKSQSRKSWASAARDVACASR